VNYLIRAVPEPVTEPVHGPDDSNPLKRGAYLMNIGCGCHTPTDHSGPLPGMTWAGGNI